MATNERNELSRMTNGELVAYRNICLMSARMQGDRSQFERHLPIVESLLTARGIAFVRGNRLASVV